MKLSKEQRHMAYMIMLAELQIINGLGYMCHIAESIGVLKNEHEIEGLFRVTDAQLKDKLPELFSKKPVGISDGSPWFMGVEKQQRVDILKQCIAETA